MTRWALTYEGLDPFTIPATDLMAASRDALSAREHIGHTLLSVVMVEEVAAARPLTSGLEKLVALDVLTDEEAKAIADTASPFDS